MPDPNSLLDIDKAIEIILKQSKIKEELPYLQIMMLMEQQQQLCFINGSTTLN